MSGLAAMFQACWWNWVESKVIDWEKTGRELGGGRPEKCLIEGQQMQGPWELKVKNVKNTEIMNSLQIPKILGLKSTTDELKSSCDSS